MFYQTEGKLFAFNLRHDGRCQLRENIAILNNSHEKFAFLCLNVTPLEK